MTIITLVSAVTYIGIIRIIYFKYRPIELVIIIILKLLIIKFEFRVRD